MIHRMAFASAPTGGYQAPRPRKKGSGQMQGEGLAPTFMTHRATLLRYLRARGVGDEAEDVLQELWFKLDGIDAELVADPLPYLYRMAHNLMLDRRRTAVRRQERERIYHRDGEEKEPSAGTERTLIARQELDEIDRALKALGERTDYVFRRHRVEEIPQRAIAEELGISLSAVEKHLQKAYRAVAACRRSAVVERRYGVLGEY
jgi:RNA polymerase sigma factor (sigma-70 family)